MTLRVAVLDDYQGVALEYGPWDELGSDLEIAIFRDHVDEIDELAERLAPFDVVVAMRERTTFPRTLLERLPRLRLLVSTGMGTPHIDTDATRELGITVSGTGGRAEPAAELTWALILALARHVAVEDAAVRRGDWQQTIGTDLAGATLGVIGLGRLGRQVASVGQAFGMSVIAWSQNLDPDEAHALGVEPVDKQFLLRTADIVTIHLRLSDRTRGLIGADDLALLKPTALLVNTSRGPIVDEQALVEVLRDRRIGGAGLDVFDVEPLPADHPLRSMPRTVLTPHIGYVTHETYRVFYADAVEAIAAFRAGNPIRVLT
ncbi:MAG TPA: D-2-hydroxyacid dehydrogenase family protein [Gaiellales bacterium]